MHVQDEKRRFLLVFCYLFGFGAVETDWTTFMEDAGKALDSSNLASFPRGNQTVELRRVEVGYQANVTNAAPKLAAEVKAVIEWYLNDPSQPGLNFRGGLLAAFCNGFIHREDWMARTTFGPTDTERNPDIFAQLESRLLRDGRFDTKIEIADGEPFLVEVFRHKTGNLEVFLNGYKSPQLGAVLNL